MLDTTEIKLFDPDGGQQPDLQRHGQRRGRQGRQRRHGLAAHEYAGNAFQAS